jgi:lysophospholipase L1-like esterase
MAFDLTFTGTPAYSAGKFGQALNGGYGLSDIPLPLDGSPFTMEAWAASTGTDYFALMGTDYVAWMGHTNAGKPWAHFGNPAVTTSASTITVNDGVLHHWSWNVDPSGVTPSRLFIDGVLAGTVAAGAAKVLDTSKTKMGVRAIAQHPSGTFLWPGQVDEVAVYSGIKRTAAFTPPTDPTPNDAPNLLAVWHLNGDGLNTRTAAAPAGVQVPYTDANIFYSPYNWDDRGTYKVSNNPGAYLKTAFTGTSVALKLDVSAMVAANLPAASYPIVRTIVDGVAVDTQLTSAGSPIVQSGLAAGAHTFEAHFLAADTATGDRWTTPVQALRVSGLTIDTGSAVLSPALRSKRMFVLGDSISEGYFANGTVKTQPAGNNCLLTVPAALAQQFDAEYGIVAFSGQGYQQTAGNVPNVLNAWNLYSAGRSRLSSGGLLPAPDFVTIEHGANGATTAANVQSLLAAVRAAVGTAKIFQFVPRGGFARAAVTAGEAAVTDANAYLIDLGTAYQPGISNFTNVANMYSLDGLHPNSLANMRAAAGFAAKVQAALSEVVQPALAARTVTLTMGDENGPAANLTGVEVSFFDEPTPGDHTIARFKTKTETTDASGTMTFTAMSTLPSGGSGSIDVKLPDGRNLFRTVTVA